MKDLPFAKQPRKKTSKKPATRAERKFMERVHALGCSVTGYKDEVGADKENRSVTIHHDTQYGKYRNHYRVVPLMGWLHLIQYGEKDSFHGDEKGWQQKHGSIKSHLIKVYKLLLNDGGLPAPAVEIYKKLKECERYTA